MIDPTERYLTFDERMKWGVCPTCKAGHGEYCHADVGLQLGVRLDGSRMKDGDGTHVSRLSLAPQRMKLVPA